MYKALKLSFDSQQEVSEAIDLAAQAIDIKPNNYDGFYARSKALLEYGNFEEALKDAKSAIDRSKNTSVDIRETLSRLHEDLTKKLINNHRRSAIESFDAITDL